MEPNEMKRYDLVGEYDLGIAPQEEGDYVHYSEAMQVITALQAKIDGMIERPKVLAIYDFLCNELAEPHDTGVLIHACTMLEEALGMDDPKEGGEG